MIKNVKEHTNLTDLEKDERIRKILESNELPDYKELVFDPSIK